MLPVGKELRKSYETCTVFMITDEPITIFHEQVSSCTYGRSCVTWIVSSPINFSPFALSLLYFQERWSLPRLFERQLNT